MFKKQRNLLSNKAFRDFTLSCALAMFGNGLTYIIMTWILMQYDASVVSTAILMACFWVPNVVLGPFWGVLADRTNRKFLLIVTNGLRAAFLFAFALISYYNHTSIMAIYGLAVVLGTVLAAYIPVAMTFVREIIDTEKDLLYANAMVDTAYELGAVMGMGCAGLILMSTSFTLCFAINGLCYLVATLFILRINYQRKNAQKEQESQESFFQQFLEGGRYIIERLPILLIYLVQGFFFICYMTAPVLLAPFAKTVLHSSVSQFGWLEAMLSSGIVVGGFVSPWLASRYSLYRIILSQIFIGALSFYLLSHTANVHLAIFYHFFIGFAFSSWALLTTLAQELTDLAYQGRVQSLFNSVSGAVIVLFYYILASWKDLPVAKLYLGEITLLCIAGILLLVMAYKKETGQDEIASIAIEPAD